MQSLAAKVLVVRDRQHGRVYKCGGHAQTAGSRSATSEEGVSLPIGRREHAGEACSIKTGMITFKEGTSHQVSLGRGFDLNGLPPLHVYVSLSATALRGSTMQTRMLSQVEVSRTSLLTLPIS